jgi:hypothetical protein
MPFYEPLPDLRVGLGTEFGRGSFVGKGYHKAAMRLDSKEIQKDYLDGFSGSKTSSDTRILMQREIDERFNIKSPLRHCMQDPRRASLLRHSYVDLIRQRVYQMAAGDEDCNDANHLWIDPALCLAPVKDKQYAASQSLLSQLENEILGNAKRLAVLGETTKGSIEALLRKNAKSRLIIDLDSTENAAHGAGRRGWRTTVFPIMRGDGMYTYHRRFHWIIISGRHSIRDE